MPCDPRMQGLVELLSAALLDLWEHRRQSLVESILDRLDILAVGDDPESRLIQLRVIDHRIDFSFAAGRLDDAIKFCEQGMKLASIDHPQYYSFSAALARTLFEKQEAKQGYETIANAILCGIDHGMDRRIVCDQLRVATFSEPRLASELDVFRDALEKYATVHCGMEDTAFIDLWNRGADHTVDALLDLEDEQVGS